MLNLFRTRSVGRLHPTLYRLTLGSFALIEFWEDGVLTGPARGRALEEAFYRYCNVAGLRLTERAGSRTLRGARSTSGLQHESDAVVVAADITIHVEMKSLSSPISKNDLMVFNQKGIDFVLSGSPEIRSRPLHRLFLTTTPMSAEARRFAAIWGIVVVEPGRLPLPLLHWLIGSDLPPIATTLVDRDRAWIEIPLLIQPLQEGLRRLPTWLDSRGHIIAEVPVDTVLDRVQMLDGSSYWGALDRRDPRWLRRAYEAMVLGETQYLVSA